MEAAAGNSYPRSLLATLPWAILFLVLALVFSGPPKDARETGNYVGSLLIPTLVGALGAWLISRRSAAWPLWRLALVALPLFLLMQLLSAAGRLAG